MKIVFFLLGNVIFTKENVPIPRAGDFVAYAGNQYEVLAVVHDYMINNIKVYLKS